METITYKSKTTNKEYEILKVQPSRENPYIIESYPYGSLRTQMRYFIDSNKKGDRIVTQTLNPQTNKWNAEKKCTYDDICIVGIDKETGYIKPVISISYNGGNYDSKTEKTNYDLQNYKVEFLEKNNILSEIQKAKLKDILRYQKIMENVTFEIKPRVFENIETGEITESINLMELKKYREVTQN